MGIEINATRDTAAIPFETRMLMEDDRLLLVPEAFTGRPRTGVI